MSIALRSTVTGIAVAACAAATGGVMADEVAIGDATWHRSEWRASTFTPSTQSEASLAIGADGSIATVWSSRRQQGGRYGVYAQRFDSSGVAIGAETCVNLWTESHQLAPAVTARSGDAVDAVDAVDASSFWMAWQSHGQDGHAGSVIARRFTARESATWEGASEIGANVAWRGHQSAPVIATDGSGGAVVVWTSAASGSDPSRIHGRRFDATGTPRGSEFVLCDVAGRDHRTPAVAGTADGGFAIAYVVSDDLAFDSAVRLQLFDASGALVTEPIDVAPAWQPNRIEPALAAGPHGIVVAWLDSASDGSDYGVLARRFDRVGTPLDAPVVVNSTTDGPQTAAAVAIAPDGGYAVAWNASDGDEGGIFGQMFTADGVRDGGEFRVNAFVAGDQSMRTGVASNRLAFAPNGALVCVWSGDAGRGDESAANVTMLTRRPVELAGRIQGVTDAMRPAVGVDAERAASATGLAAPHEPPTFDARSIDDGEREVTVSPGGDVGFTGVFNTGWTPPDPHLAVGPDHVVVMTNGEIAFFTKDGTRTFVDEIEGGGGFWGPVGASGFIFDPEVVYDDLSGRFFAFAADRDSSNGNSYSLIGVSDDSDPNGTWYKYRFNTTALAGPTFDSPNIGIGADVVYVTGDGFGGPQPYPVYTYDKASLLAGDPPAVERSTFLPTSTQSAGIPPVSFDDPPAIYMIEHREGGTDTAVRLVALQDPLGTPTFSTTTLTVPAYDGPEDPPQAGSSSRPNTFDQRFWSCAYRNGSLWATHHIGSSRVLARWYEIAMNGWPDSGDLPTLVQSGEIDPGETVRTFFPAITVDEFGNAAIVYSRSSPTEAFSIETAFRYKTDPLGTFRPGVQRQVTTGVYTAGRWGDYSAINVDPTDGKTFWSHHEYAINGSWRTWVTGFTPAFNFADANCDGAVGINDVLVVLADWGPCGGCPGDINNDGFVTFEDLLLVLQEWGMDP